MHLWADHFDSGIENIFDLQEQDENSLLRSASRLLHSCSRHAHSSQRR